MFILLSYREDGTSVKKTGDVWRGLIEEATESLGDLVDISWEARVNNGAEKFNPRSDCSPHLPPRRRATTTP